jgi:hypothetical protein
MSNRRRITRNLAVERLEARQLLTFVAVDFHNHYFAHYGESSSSWMQTLSAKKRTDHLSTILAGSNLNPTLPEFVAFTEHAGRKPYNHRSAVIDLESKLATALKDRPNGAASYGASVGIELSPNAKKNPHFGIPFVDVNSLASNYYNSSTDFGLAKLVTIASLPNQQGLMVWNHPAKTALNDNGNINQDTMQKYLDFMTNTYTKDFRTTSVRASLAAIEFPKYLANYDENREVNKKPDKKPEVNFVDRFKFTEHLMVAATIDGFSLTPTIGSDSHTVFNPLRQATPFVAEKTPIRHGIGILDVKLDTTSSENGLIPESSVKDALSARRGSAIYQRDATISVNGNVGRTVVREGEKVPSLPTTLTVNTERFPAELISRVEARYVIRENFTSSSFLNAMFATKIVPQTTTANSAKTSFTFSTANRGNIALIYFVALDSQNVPVAITAPITVNGSAAVLSPMAALSQPVSNSNPIASNTRTNLVTSTARTDVDSAIQSANLPASSSQTSNSRTASLVTKTRKLPQAPASREFETVDAIFAQYRAADLLDSSFQQL